MAGLKLASIAGARPNFMKVAAVSRAIEAWNRKQTGTAKRIEQLLVHTGQHYDQAMSQSFFDDLGIPRPDINLGVGSGSHAAQTAEIMRRFEEVALAERPDLVLVVGDVNSTLACSLVAAKLLIPVAHVEAGLRSFDRTMPEEINRLLTDQISDLLFITSPEARENLLREGIPARKVFFVGNVMIDTLRQHLERAEREPVLEEMGLADDGSLRPYGLLTLHRPSNVDSKEVLTRLTDVLSRVARDLPIIFPVHPRTRKQLTAFGLLGRFEELSSPVKASGIHLVPPLGYLAFLNLTSKASLVLTDSGGIQEETTILGVPCITLRENTERPVTVTHGTNTVVGTSPRKILAACRKALEPSPGKRTLRPRLWDGRAAERIVSVIARKMMG